MLYSLKRSKNKTVVLPEELVKSLMRGDKFVVTIKGKGVEIKRHKGVEEKKVFEYRMKQKKVSRQTWKRIEKLFERIREQPDNLEISLSEFVFRDRFSRK